MSKHEAGIKVSSLGQTIQDAIGVARTLGIAFLWVDSLYIIQDSPEDLATEISRMSDYFENGFVCISAAIAASSNEGFLKPRTGNLYNYGAFELPYRGPNNRLGSVKLVTYHDYQNGLDPANARA